jgi:hypothetical protein|eukprot:COSAG01_NODE_6716_length_3531_cov_3.330711_2_plen_51_part_00
MILMLGQHRPRDKSMPPPVHVQDSEDEGPLSDAEAERRIEAAKNFKPGFF